MERARRGLRRELLWNRADGSTFTQYTEGDLCVHSSDSLVYHAVRGNISKSSGRWYFEYQIAYRGAYSIVLGLAWKSAGIDGTGAYPGSDLRGLGWWSGGRLYYNGSYVSLAANFVTGDCVGFGVDCTAPNTAARVSIWKNGVLAYEHTNGLQVIGPVASDPQQLGLFPMVGIQGDTWIRVAGKRELAKYPLPMGFSWWGDMIP